MICFGVLPSYQDEELLSNRPYAGLDHKGVGQLVEVGVEGRRSTKNKLKIGILGSYGGEPASGTSIGLDSTTSPVQQVSDPSCQVSSCSGCAGRARGAISWPWLPEIFTGSRHWRDPVFLFGVVCCSSGMGMNYVRIGL